MGRAGSAGSPRKIGAQDAGLIRSTWAFGSSTSVRSYWPGSSHTLSPCPRSAQDTQFGFRADTQAAKSNGVRQNKISDNDNSGGGDQ